MASVRRGQGPMTIDLQTTDQPPISALFLIYFDVKAGYTVGWKRSLPGIELEGVVEYKSLPSGLHTVDEDLIYFVHENHAGLSAFVNVPAGEEVRNARMIAVGVLVPLSYGRLGRSWRHAEKLKEMASELISDLTKTHILEEFWEAYKGSEKSSEDLLMPTLADSPMSSSTNIRFKSSGTSAKRGHGRNRSASDGTMLVPAGHNLPLYHPAWSLLQLLDTFGPLIFRIHRAALLRKRILITTHAPVEQACNFVYDLSVLSNIPQAVSNLLVSTAPPQRLRPLFCIGVHDIPLLESDLNASMKAPPSDSEEVENRDDAGHGWIACTTDSILSTKSRLYDVLITMPANYAADASRHVWPKVEFPQGTVLRATQRDLRRYKALRWGLAHHTSPPSTPGSPSSNPLDVPSSTPRDDPMLNLPDADSILEPLSWSALAYSGFMWWASAGEQRLHSDSEVEADNALLSGLLLAPATPITPRTPSQSILRLKAEGAAKQELGIIAYFHRLTTQILTTLSDIVDITDSDDERDAGDSDEESEPPIWISEADMERMGLDVWSPDDHLFVEEMAREYFGRRATFEGRTVDICGVRIC